MPRKDQETANKPTQDKSKVGKEDKTYSLTLLMSQRLQESFKSLGNYEQLNEDLGQECMQFCSPCYHFFLLKCNTEHAKWCY